MFIAEVQCAAVQCRSELSAGKIIEVGKCMFVGIVYNFICDFILILYIFVHNLFASLVYN